MNNLLLSLKKKSVLIAGFARFNTIITSLKALDEGFSSKNYVRKFLRALHPKWRVKVTAIEESKDLSSLALDELIGNLKVHEVVMEKDSKIYRGKKERVKSIALKKLRKSLVMMKLRHPEAMTKNMLWPLLLLIGCGSIIPMWIVVVENKRTDMVKRDVEIETVGEGVDEIDKLAELTDEMQLKQEDQGCVHASNELQLHVVHVVADEHEVDQH
ncbi:hypothetical protein Tco_1192120 [Tanacetum coccineum]